MALYLDVGPADVLRIGGVTVTVERKTGSRARLRIENADDVRLLRNERDPDTTPKRISAAQPRSNTHG